MGADIGDFGVMAVCTGQPRPATPRPGKENPRRVTTVDGRSIKADEEEDAEEDDDEDKDDVDRDRPGPDSGKMGIAACRLLILPPPRTPPAEEPSVTLAAAGIVKP